MQISHETLAGKLIRLPFRLIPKGAVVRILRGPARGMRWVSDSSYRSFWLGYWELDHQKWFAAHLHPGDSVWDVGAHVGLFTLIASRYTGDTGHVYSFEPFPANVASLRKHIELNRLSNCTVVEAAVCDKVGTLRFEPTMHNSAGHLSSEGSIAVRTVALDGYLASEARPRPPKVIKIDAEGAEMSVLRGAQRIISEYAPSIFLSLHNVDADRQCTAFLEAENYSITRLSVDDVWAERR